MLVYQRVPPFFIHILTIINSILTNQTLFLMCVLNVFPSTSTRPCRVAVAVSEVPGRSPVSPRRRQDASLPTGEDEGYQGRGGGPFVTSQEL